MSSCCDQIEHHLRTALSWAYCRIGYMSASRPDIGSYVTLLPLGPEKVQIPVQIIYNTLQLLVYYVDINQATFKVQTLHGGYVTMPEL